MSDFLEKTTDSKKGVGVEAETSLPEKGKDGDLMIVSEDEIGAIQNDLTISRDDLISAEADAKNMSLEDVRRILSDVIQIHENDQNFPGNVLQRMEEFLVNKDVLENPSAHEKLIHEMKVEAALIQNNSPYMEVRAVVNNTDDTTLPSSTIRSWIIGLVLVGAGAFVNALFNIRQPTVMIEANVAQVVAYPIGKAWERLLPDWRFTLFGVEHSLNPGRFSKKEHMLVTIMANVGFTLPYTNNIIWSQYLPSYFNQHYAGHFGYQILIGLSTNFIGYGIAGLARRFLVYPSHCVWPASLVTIALNESFHSDTNRPATGPFRHIFKISRLRCFVYFFSFMLIYFWFPNYLFQALSYFNWMTWIAPSKLNLAVVTGMVNGLGINPISTFDWNILTFDQGRSPLVLPFFFWWNAFLGLLVSTPVAAAIWYTNTFNTGYLPINSVRIFDHFGKQYNVSRAINDRGLFDPEKYQNYSPPFMPAGYVTLYTFFFGLYVATITYAVLWHRREIWVGLRSLFRRDKEQIVYQDIHNRLMSKYREVSEWWYLAVLLCAIGCGIGGIAGWQTFTTPGVIFYGIALCLVFVVPVGLIMAITGMEVTLNVLAEFIGGSWAAGNALAMNYFKSYGYVTCSHAVHFSNDLKIAHYTKIPPWHTFSAQIIASAVSTFVCTAVLNFQMNKIKGVCTVDQPQHFTCPGINNFFTAAVVWGTVGPIKAFGKGGLYTPLLVGFPLGLAVTVGVYYLRKLFPKRRYLRNIHPVVFFYGGTYWAPYNLSYLWPCVPVAWLSQVFFKKRYSSLWSKYNYVISAAFSAAVAIAAVVIFFALQWPDVTLNWWGNTVSFQGCEGTACTLLELKDGEYFGPRIGEFH